MFGLDDPKPDEQLPDPPTRRRLVVRWEELPPERPDTAEARAQLFLDEQRAERFILLNRRVQLAMVLSLLFHLGLVLLLPAGNRWLVAMEEEARRREDQTIPPVYLLPYLPQQEPEPPASRQAPRSDLDRRAHGGLGAPADRPGSKGNTFEPRLEPPSAPASPPAGTDAGTAQRPGEAEREGSKVADLGDKGAEAVLQMPKEARDGRDGSTPGQPLLRGLGAAGRVGGSGAVPDRSGGQVDLGPLSFETEWYEWGPYAAEMLRRIRYHWLIPEIAQLGVPGVVRIHFYIERTGRVSGLEIEKVSGHPPMDFAARDAILDASPLPPLPADLTGVERERVTITFFYNTKPPDDGR
ncbi:MAG: TonB C-terminal domain-containing protein [Acidobacteria bacterium]|nr:TonB C-terminal domain-containing protein [Acidobacteriota bacterium]